MKDPSKNISHVMGEARISDINMLFPTKEVLQRLKMLLR